MKKPIVLFLIPAMLSTVSVMAIDFSKFEATCLEIGFKRNTETFGDCVLELAGRAKKSDAQKAQLQVQEDQRRQYENQRQREAAALRQQQEQQAYYAQQQQLLAQQQQKAKEDADSSWLLKGIVMGLVEMNRKPVQIYQPPINCTSRLIGSFVSTNCW